MNGHEQEASHRNARSGVRHCRTGRCPDKHRRGILPASCAMRRVLCCPASPWWPNMLPAPEESRASPTTVDTISTRTCASAYMSSPPNCRDSGAWFEGIVLQVGQAVTLDFTLEVGGITEEIRVSAEAPQLRTANAEISNIVENRQMVQMPLNGRNFLALAQLSDAVVLPPGGTRGRRAAAGWSAAERGRAALGSQHLSARRREGDRRAVQQSRHQSVGRLHPGVQNPEVACIRPSSAARHRRSSTSRRGPARTRSAAALFEFAPPRHVRRATTISTSRASPCRRCARTSSAASLGGAAAPAIAAFSSRSYEGQRMRRSLSRTFSVPLFSLRDAAASPGSTRFATPGRSAGASRFPAIASQPSASIRWPSRFSSKSLDLSLARTLAAGKGLAARAALGDLQHAEQGELRHTRIARSAPRISAGFSARKTRVRCSSARD